MADENTQARQRRKESHQSFSKKDSVSSQNVTLDIESDDKEEEKNSLYLKEKNKVSGSFTLISVIILITVTLLFVKYMDTRLPSPLTEKDLFNNSKSFIEERARRDLHTLTGIGIRVSGSYATDIITVDLVVKLLEDIKKNSSSFYNLDFDIQRPSGSFWLDDDEGSTSSYSKIANVVAKMEPSDASKRTNSSILLNCHIDTKPGSPGATDNMISCCVMLEILRVLSSQELGIRNTIILLFNAAEELGLQGAHGFVKGTTVPASEWGHPWSKNIKAFVNLEGAGAGGREILFQATGGDSQQTGWLIKAYKSVPYPYGTVLAEEAFQFGLIPSDTDFRIFRDFGGIAGLDIAFIKNGWVYHTKWDKLSEIPPGSIQHMGSNALKITEELGNFDFSVEHNSSGEMVFFDVLGAFMITYSKTVGIVINLLVALITLAIIVWHVGWKLKILLTYLRMMGSTILSWGLALGVVAIVATFLNGAGYYKPFYSYPSLAAILFGIPAILTEIIVYSFCTKSSPKETWLAGRFTLAIILFVATFITRASYIFAIPLIFGVVGWFGARYLMQGWPRALMIAYMIVGELIPLIMSSYLIVTLADVFVPILGRSGSEMNGNLFFGLIIGAMIGILSLSGLASLFVNYDRKILVTCLLISVFLVNPMIVFGFLGKIPYQEKTPMRLTICEVDRIWHDRRGTEIKSESGYWFWPLDSNTDEFFSEFSKTATEVNLVKDVKLDYENCENLYCSQPFIWPTTSRIKKTHWLSKSVQLSSNIREQVEMKVMENTTIGSPNRRRISLDFLGPSQMTVVLSPQKSWDAKITLDVMGNNVPVLKEGSNRWKGRKVYYIYHGRGYHNDPLKLTIELERTGSFSSSEEEDDHFVDIQLSGLFLHSTEAVTVNYTDFINRFPSWTYNMGWASVMKMYKI